MKEAVLVSGVRTAIGKFGGSLKDTPSIDLMGMVIKEALVRGKVDPELVGDVIVGQCMQRSDEYVTGMFSGREVVFLPCWPSFTPPSRLCSATRTAWSPAASRS